jgi:hypothetical protein
MNYYRYIGEDIDISDNEEDAAEEDEDQLCYDDVIVPDGHFHPEDSMHGLDELRPQRRQASLQLGGSSCGVLFLSDDNKHVDSRLSQYMAVIYPQIDDSSLRVLSAAAKKAPTTDKIANEQISNPLKSGTEVASNTVASAASNQSQTSRPAGKVRAKIDTFPMSEVYFYNV